MKNLIVTFLLLPAAASVFGQAADTRVWTRLTGSSSDDNGYAVAADNFGNAIIAGATQGSITGGNFGRYDMFVAKYNSNGTRLWVRQKGTAQREYAFGVATDQTGNIYTTGYTGESLDGQPHAGDPGDFDVFLMKFDPSGNWQWTREFGFGPKDEWGNAVATDRFGNVYVTGVIRGALDGLPRPGVADVFIRKYDSAGNKLWSALFGTEDVDEGVGITCDADGNVFVTGWCSGSIDGTTVYQGNGDNFLAKYSSTGQQLWIKQWGTWNKDTGYCVSTDAAGNVFVSGYSTGPLYGIPNAGNRDLFVAKYDPSGNLLWGTKYGTSGHDQGWGCATDPAGNIYVAGETGGSYDGGSYEGFLDVVLTKYDGAGTKLWSQQYGTSEFDLARGVAVATNGVVFVTGWTGGNLDGNVNAGPYDPFISKFVPSTTVPPPAPTAKPATGVTSNAFMANWTASGTVTGCRLDVSTNATFANYLSGYQNLDVGNVTNRLVTNLTPTTTYYYRVRAYNIHGTSANSATMPVTLAAGSPCASLANANFEDGFSLSGIGYIGNGWTKWESKPGVTVGFNETVTVHGGGHSQRLRVEGTTTNATSGGIFQRIPVISGNPYTVSVWIYAGDPQSACSLGVDPAGGTNGTSGSVVWSSTTTNVAWVQKTWSGTATANLLTVFFRVAAPDTTRRNGYFDDATPAGAGALQLRSQFNGTALTLTWPDCPAAHLERTLDLGEFVGWTTATNQVNYVGGQKTVTISPTQNSAFFRLVQE